MGLEKGTNQLSGAKLQVVLVLAFFLDKGQIFLVKRVILIFLFFFFHVLEFLDSQEGLVNNFECGISELLNLSLGKETLSGFKQDFLHGADLRAEALGFSFFLHGLVDVGIVIAGQIVDFGGDTALLVLNSFKETGEGGDAGGSNTLIVGEVGKGEHNLLSLGNKLEECITKFVNENTEHLNSNFFLFNFVGNDVGFLVGGGFGLDFVKNICQCVGNILSSNSHLGVKGSHAENAGQNMGKVLCELVLHKQANSLPCAQKVNSLAIFSFELLGLDLKHSLDNLIGNLHKWNLTDTSAHNSDGLNDLTTELLVFLGRELTKLGNQDDDSFFEVWDKAFLRLFDNSGKSSHGVFLDKGAAGLNKG